MAVLFLLLLLVQKSWASCPTGSVFDASFNSQSNYWIGAHNSGNWSWTDDLPFSYTNWGPTQPDNSKLCAYVDIISYKWYADDCSTARPYVCVVPQEVPTTLGPCPTTAADNGGWCEDGWSIFRSMDSCYKKFYNNDFTQAESACKSLGGHLTSIHSEAENMFIIGLAQFVIDQKIYLGLTTTGLKLEGTNMTWIGLRKSKKQGWEWTDGTLVDYTNWEPGEPADIPLVVEDCTSLISDQEKLKPKAYMLWRNVHCNKEQRAFVCKKKALHS